MFVILTKSSAYELKAKHNACSFFAVIAPLYRVGALDIHDFSGKSQFPRSCKINSEHARSQTVNHLEAQLPRRGIASAG